MKLKFWILILLAVLVVPIALLEAYLWLPLPPPKVALEFKGFKSEGTNVFAMMSITNTGRNEIYWFGEGWEGAMEPRHGWVTNRPHIFYSGSRAPIPE